MDFQLPAGREAMRNIKFEPVLSPVLGFALVALIALPLPAQQPVKKLTYNQAFLDKGSQLIMAGPSIKSWLDADRYLFIEFWFKHFLGR
jgi:hypothetical protein